MTISRPLVRTVAAGRAVAAALLALLVTGGCNRTWQAYDGPARPPSQVALLRLPPNVVAGSLSLDGVPGPEGRVTRVEVEPGEHRIRWGYRHANRHVAEQTVRFSAGAGEELHLVQTFFRDPGPLGLVGDAVTLAVESALIPIRWLLPAGEAPPDGRFHAWVEGPGGRIVGGLPPDVPSGYVETTFLSVDDLP